MKAEQLISNNMDIWTTAIKKRSATGRGSNKKIELTGIKKLRELILELAVRGKLVPQDLNDEPASVLLEKIATEKAQLIKDKKIKKSKVLPEIGEDEKPFELPNRWKWSNLNNLITIMDAGWSPSCPSEASPSVEKWGVLKTTAVQSMEYRQYENKVLADSKEPRPQYEVKTGDILITRAGPKNRVGVSCLVESTRPKLMISDKIIRFHLVEVGMCERYISLCLNAGVTAEYLESAKSGMAESQMNISQDKLKVAPIPLCAVNEQHRIVAKVDEFMRLCDQLEQQTEDSITAHQTLVESLLATLTTSENTEALTAEEGGNEENAGAISFESNWTRIAKHFDTLFTTEHSIDQLKQTILQLAVMGKLVPQNSNDEPASVLLEKIAAEKEQLIKDKKIKKQKPLPVITEDEKPFELPNGWGFSHLQELCSLITDGTHLTPKYTKKGRPFISAQCVKPFKFIPEKCRYVSEEHYQNYIKNRKPEYKDVLLARVGAGIGEAAVIDTHLEFAIYVSTGLLKPFKDFLVSEYLTLWLNSPIGRHSSEKNTLGKGVSQGNLNLSLIRTFVIPVPPLAEQQRIIKKVDELMTLCDQLKENISQAQTTQLHLADTIVEQAVS